MELHEEPQVTQRNIVLKDAAKRKSAKARLLSNIRSARISLTPRHQLHRFVERNKVKVKVVVDEAALVARKGAPIAVALGLGVLLFVARGPISKWISRLRNAKTAKPGND